MADLVLDVEGFRALLADVDRIAGLAVLDGEVEGDGRGDDRGRRSRTGPGARPPAAGLVVVDVRTPGRLPPVRPPGPLPFVTVGVGTAGRAAPAAVLDLMLTEVPAPEEVPAPWVGVPDLAAALAALSAAVARSPRAAVVLAHVLRAGERGSLADAVTVESLAYSTLQAGPEFGRWLARRRPPTARPREHEVLALERRGEELHVVLDRPAVRNAVNAALRDALCEAFGLATLDESVTMLHLSGRGRDFCSGGDLDEFGTAPDPASAHLVRTARSSALALDAVPARTVAHLHGACIGAGIEIAAAADRVVAAPDTRIRLPEVGMGLVPGAGGTATIPRRIGRHRTAWLALSGEELGVERAREWGLVDEVG